MNNAGMIRSRGNAATFLPTKNDAVLYVLLILSRINTLLYKLKAARLANIPAKITQESIKKIAPSAFWMRLKSVSPFL